MWIVHCGVIFFVILFLVVWQSVTAVLYVSAADKASLLRTKI